jgi:hypothetical protein
MHADSTFWTFGEIAAREAGRAALLESAPDPDAIRAAVVSHFEAALEGGRLRVGMEQSSSNPSDLRVVLQFPVGEDLYDQFFNANTGYRAQFRRDWQTGLAYNRSIVTEMRSKLASFLPDEVLVRCLSSKFEDCGELTIPREKIYQSLDPDLSKVWFCGRLIVGDGTVVQLPSGATGPRLRLDEESTWAALARDESDAWLDVKGAFVGRDGPYQPKDPRERAKKLQSTGEA